MTLPPNRSTGPHRSPGHLARRDLMKTGGALAAAAMLAGVPIGSRTARAAAARGASAHSALAWLRVPAILTRIVPPSFPPRTFDITRYGARPDDSTDCTAAFRDAIAACHGAGGGTVLVPGPGGYRTGRIELRSNVRLHVDGGATIRFHTDPAAYLPNVFTRWEGIECYNYSPFIHADGAANIAITGTGTIDGNATAGQWASWGGGGDDSARLREYGANDTPVAERQFGAGHRLRPNLIGLYNSRNILVEGVTCTNPAMWTLHPVYCSNVTVRDVTFRSTNSQGDGVDPDSCTDVHITGCRFDTNDDCIPIKSGRDRDGRRVGRPSQNIVVQNCKFSGRWGGITIGSEMSGGVRNVFAQDCEVNPADFPGRHPVKYALYIKTSFNRGGFVEGVHLRRFTGRALERDALYVTMNYETTGALPPTVREITVDGMRIDGARSAFNLDGRAEKHIEDVRITGSAFTGMANATQTVNYVDRLSLHGVRVNGRDISTGREW